LHILKPIPTTLNAAAFVNDDLDFRKAPPAVTGDNVYIAWWTNKTANGNNEVMFRSSTDGGTTFDDNQPKQHN
jgi:hypothetical protein